MGEWRLPLGENVRSRVNKGLMIQEISVNHSDEMMRYYTNIQLNSRLTNKLEFYIYFKL